MGTFSRLFTGLKSLFGSPEKPDAAPALTARIAAFDSFLAPPRVVEVSSSDPTELISKLASDTYKLACEAGGKIPFVPIREVVENLIHAAFRDVVITVYPRGATVVVSDRGPGISDVRKALEPGFSTANDSMRKYIRGVGSGLPIARECMVAMGGDLTIESNMGAGTVISLRASSLPLQTRRPASAPVSGPSSVLAEPDEYSVKSEPAGRTSPAGETTASDEYQNAVSAAGERPDVHPSRCDPGEGSPSKTDGLTERQRQVLRAVMTQGEAGPSAISSMTGLSLSTAYRELVALEERGLLVSLPNGRRKAVSP